MVKSENNVIHGYRPLQQLPQTSLGQYIYDGLMNKENKNDEAIIDVTTKEYVTYKNILEKSTHLAHSLKNCGYGKNSIFSITSENNVFFFYPVIAALYMGAITAPMNPNYTKNELIHALSISKPKVMFCSKTCLQKILEIKQSANFIERIILIDVQQEFHINGIETLEGFIKNNTDTNFNPTLFRPTSVKIVEHGAFIMCSSGTTGLPKGVMTTHKNIHVRIAQLKDPRITKIRHNDTFFCIMPFFHAYGFIVTLGYITEGHKVVTMPKFDERLFLRTIQDYKIETLWLVPPIIIFLAKSPLVNNYNLNSVDEIVCGAAPLSKETEEACLKRLKNVKTVRQAYGMTEATLAVTILPTNDYKPGSSGKVVSFMSLKICDTETGKSLGPGEVGEICLKGAMIMKGYFNNEEATRNIIDQDGWLHSGDLGYYDNDGYLFVVDRQKELIKYKGYQVPPAELEALLLKNSKIKDAGVVGLPDEVAGELPFAFIVKAPGISLTEKEVQDFVSENVSPQKRLRGGVQFLDEIPKNPSGKILRRELRTLLKKLTSKL